MATGGVLSGNCDSWMHVGSSGMPSLECGTRSDESSFVWGCLVFWGCVIGFYVGLEVAAVAGSAIFGHDVPSVSFSNIISVIL